MTMMTINLMMIINLLMILMTMMMMMMMMTMIMMMMSMTWLAAKDFRLNRAEDRGWKTKVFPVIMLMMTRRKIMMI